MSEVLSVEQAAELLRLSPRKVREYLKAGQLPGRKLGRAWQIPKQALFDSLKGNTEGDRPPKAEG